MDAANLGAAPGTVSIVTRDRIKETEITTHRVAVALMASVLEKAGITSAVVCIQPLRIDFQAAMSKPVADAVEKVAGILSDIMRSKP